MAKTLIFSLWLAHSSHSSDKKLLMCTLISPLKQHFLPLITFCTYFERCSNFEFEAVRIFYVIVSQCKWVSGIDTYEAEIAADSIIWELFARKSAECWNLRNLFITISSFSQNTNKKQKIVKISVLCNDGKNLGNFWFVFWEKPWLHEIHSEINWPLECRLCSIMQKKWPPDSYHH